jgi:CBS domain-containing protein
MTATVVEHYQKDVATIPAESQVREAAAIMRARAVGSLVIIRDGQPAGIVTDRDLLERVIADGKDAGATTMADVMSEPLRTVSPEDPLDRVIELMATHGIRRVPVVGKGELVGIVALDDVAAEIAEELHDLAQGARRELAMAHGRSRVREIAGEIHDRIADLGEQLEHAGGEVKDTLLRELDGLRERIGDRKH